jgi:hypothetical protein
MATVFWGRKGVLMVEVMQQGTTVTLEAYYENSKKLLRTIQNKRCEMLTTSIVLLQKCVSTYSCLHSSAAGAFQPGVV